MLQSNKTTAVPTSVNKNLQRPLGFSDWSTVLDLNLWHCVKCNYLKSSFPKRYKSILIVFMKMTFFYLDPYILLIFNLSC